MIFAGNDFYSEFEIVKELKDIDLIKAIEYVPL